MIVVFDTPAFFARAFTPSSCSTRHSRNVFKSPPLLTPVPVTKHILNPRSEEHTSELQSLMRISYAVFCLKTKIIKKHNNTLITYVHSTQTKITKTIQH